MALLRFMPLRPLVILGREVGVYPPLLLPCVRRLGRIGGVVAPPFVCGHVFIARGPLLPPLSGVSRWRCAVVLVAAPCALTESPLGVCVLPLLYV